MWGKAPAAVAAEQIVRAVWEKGHRRLALIHGEDSLVTQERNAGFYKACAELGLQIPAAFVRRGLFHSPDNCAEQVKALLRDIQAHPQ